LLRETILYNLTQSYLKKSEFFRKEILKAKHFWNYLMEYNSYSHAYKLVL